MRAWVVFLAFWPWPAWGVFEDKPSSARAAAMGGALVAAADPGGAAWENPALLPLLMEKEITADHGVPTALEELRRSTLGLVMPGRRIAWAMGLSEFGSSLYREREIAAAVGGTAGAGMTVGVAMKGRRVDIERYGRAPGLQWDLGVSGRWSDRWRLGVRLGNVGGARYFGETPPVTLIAGASAALWREAITALAMAREDGGHTAWRFGQEVRVGPFSPRLGFQTDPQRLSLGAGFRWGDARLDYALSTQAAWTDEHRFSFGWLW